VPALAEVQAASPVPARTTLATPATSRRRETPLTPRA
jgi:hypothetical protein